MYRIIQAELTWDKHIRLKAIQEIIFWLNILIRLKSSLPSLPLLIFTQVITPYPHNFFLTLSSIMCQNGRTHFKKLAAFAVRFLKCV